MLLSKTNVVIEGWLIWIGLGNDLKLIFALLNISSILSVHHDHENEQFLMVPIFIVPLSISEDLFRKRLTLFCARESLSLVPEHISGELISEE